MRLPVFMLPLALAYGVEFMGKQAGGKGFARAFSIAGWATLALTGLSLRSAWSCGDAERLGESLAGGAIAVIACFVLASMRREDEEGAPATKSWRPTRVSRYFRREREATAHGPLAGWGTSTQLAEVDHNLFMTRLAQVFEDGRALKYDEAAHEGDAYGGLADTAVDVEEEGWLEISSAEFDRVWEGTRESNREVSADTAINDSRSGTADPTAARSSTTRAPSTRAP